MRQAGTGTEKRKQQNLPWDLSLQHKNLSVYGISPSPFPFSMAFPIGVFPGRLDFFLSDVGSKAGLMP